MFEDSTHGGRQNWWLRYPTFLRTSTHALTEGDFVAEKVPALDFHFNSRPHGGRPSSTHILSQNLRFQLTPSRRATMNHFQLTQIGLFQLTPSRRATLGIVSPLVAYLFQLTPSRRATDCRITSVNSHLTFQLTPSRRATGQVSFHCRYGEISTHALTEGDKNIYMLLR